MNRKQTPDKHLISGQVLDNKLLQYVCVKTFLWSFSGIAGHYRLDKHGDRDVTLSVIYTTTDNRVFCFSALIITLFSSDQKTDNSLKNNHFINNVSKRYLKIKAICVEFLLSYSVLCWNLSFSTHMWSLVSNFIHIRHWGQHHQSDWDRPFLPLGKKTS